MRFYRYMIYRFYSWRLKKNDETPITTTELLMILPHFFQIATLYVIFLHFFPLLKPNFSKLQLVGFFIVFQLLYHLLIYNKKKWMSYIEEFKHESHDKRKKGTTLIFFYTFLTYLLFFGSLISLF